MRFKGQTENLSRFPTVADSSEIFVCIFPVSYPDNRDDFNLLFEVIDHPIFSDAHSIVMFIALYFRRVFRKGVLLERLDGVQDMPADTPREFAQVFPNGFFKDDLVPHSNS